MLVLLLLLLLVLHTVLLVVICPQVQSALGSGGSVCSGIRQLSLLWDQAVQSALGSGGSVFTLPRLAPQHKLLVSAVDCHLLVLNCF